MLKGRTPICAAVFLAVVLGAGGVSAQVQPETAAVDSITADMDSTAMVVLVDRDLFEVGPQSVEGADARAEALGTAILEAAKSRRLSTGDLRLIRDDRIGATLIMAKRLFLGAVWDYEADELGVTTEELAAQRLEIIRQAITDYRSDFSARSLIRGAIFGGAAVIALLVLLKLFAVLRRRFEKMLERRLAGRTLFKVLEGESVVGAVTAFDRLVYISVAIWLILATLNFVLSLFPWTAGVASDVFDLAAGPLRAFGKALVEQAPSFFFLAFIGIVTVVILRGIRFFFLEIERERIKFSGFYSDWARPTFNIIRLVVLAFAIVVAIPYIPGSGSGAFKGMSLFLGVLVSLGSGSAVTNIVSGVILIYMRPFALGDRVQIGEAIGDVVDRNLLTTRIRTPKNERVTIPNSNILSGHIINFTS
jgi:small-conductance mechanosensitive channel